MTTQPIAIRDTVAALAALADPTGHAPSEVQLGGADVLSHREMMRRHAAVAGRRSPLGEAVREALAEDAG